MMALWESFSLRFWQFGGNWGRNRLTFGENLGGIAQRRTTLSGFFQRQEKRFAPGPPEERRTGGGQGGKQFSGLMIKLWSLPAGTAGLLVGFAAAIVALGREELIHREGNVLEELAGVVAVVAAVGAGGAALFGETVVVHGHQQLTVPLQADNGELTQGDEHPTAVLARRQVAAEALAYAGGNLAQVAVAAAAVTALHYLGAQDDGIYRLHHGRKIGIVLAIAKSFFLL